jgi:hypothetical protein
MATSHCASGNKPGFRALSGNPNMIGHPMSRSGLRSRAMTCTYAAIAVAALSAALCWPAASFASADYTDRALRKDAIERTQPVARVNSVPAVAAPIYNGPYGPVIRPASFFGGRW